FPSRPALCISLRPLSIRKHPLRETAAITLGPFVRSLLLSLSWKREFSRRIPLLQSLHLPVLHHELINGIGELRRAELQPFHQHQFLRRTAREYQGKPSSRLIEHFKFDFTRSQVHSSQLFQHLRVQRLPPP